MKHRQFATAWVTDNITFHDEPMQVLAFLVSHDMGIDVTHMTCRSMGIPIYGQYKEEFGLDDKDLALKYWEGCKEKDSDVRARIEQAFADQLGFGVPF